MKKIFLILILSLIFAFLYSCKNDTVTNPTNSGINNISGTFSGWTHGNNVYLVATLNMDTFLIQMDSVLIGNDGSFNLPLLTPQDTYLRTVNSNMGFCGTIHPNPNTTKYANVMFGLHSNGIVKGMVWKCNFDSSNIQTGSIIVNYIYFNQTINVSGAEKCGNVDTICTLFNYSGVKGWNKWVEFWTKRTSTMDSISIQDSEPAGAIWRYEWNGN